MLRLFPYIYTYISFFVRGITESLRSLDLSYNSLEDVPFKAFRDLKKLNWLNMHRYAKNSNHLK